jgi:hypothetical protein
MLDFEVHGIGLKIFINYNPIQADLILSHQDMFYYMGNERYTELE